MALSTLKTDNPKINGKNYDLSFNHTEKSTSSPIKNFSTVFSGSDSNKITKKSNNENSKNQIQHSDHVILNHDHITLSFYHIYMFICNHHYHLNILIDSGSVRLIWSHKVLVFS